ncbi:MAG: acyltransferase [Solirubrobacteraceae bacterium]|nr:acyltransferase [Solirubrobacteraceae bacterium]
MSVVDRRPVRAVRRRVARALDWRVPHVASRLRRAWLLFRHPDVDLRIDPSAFIGPGFRLDAREGGSLWIGATTEFRRGGTIEIGPQAEVRIGERVIFTDGALIQITTRLEIGDNAALGQDVAIFDGRHRFGTADKHFLQQGYVLRPIVIGEGAAIHSKVTVTASVGAGAVVAANSLVNREIPDGALAAGVPARARGRARNLPDVEAADQAR